jgi:hypothetical protein
MAQAMCTACGLFVLWVQAGSRRDFPGSPKGRPQHRSLRACRRHEHTRQLPPLGRADPPPSSFPPAVLQREVPSLSAELENLSKDRAALCGPFSFVPWRVTFSAAPACCGVHGHMADGNRGQGAVCLAARWRRSARSVPRSGVFRLTSAAGSPRPRRTLIQVVAASCPRCCAASAAARPG